jgi:hypothetical protein
MIAVSRPTATIAPNGRKWGNGCPSTWVGNRTPAPWSTLNYRSLKQSPANLVSDFFAA